MAEIVSVASQAGLVLELVQRQIEGADRSQLRIISEKLKPYSESCRLNFSPLPLDGYIIHRPFHAHVCGDFHVLSKVDTSVFGLLIGDGEGKAVSGPLNARTVTISTTVANMSLNRFSGFIQPMRLCFFAHRIMAGHWSRKQL
jgi:hypothetical protein